MLTPAAACTKLLHVGNDRELAYRLAGALQRARQDVVVASVARLSEAKRWVSDNPDFGALIVEDHVQSQSCAGFIGEVRGLGLTAPVVAISVKGAEPPLAALRAGADDYVVNGQSLVPDLAGAVVRSLHRAKSLTAKRPLRCLYLGDSALARESFQDAPHAIQIVEPDRQSTNGANPIPVDAPAPGQKFPFDVVLAEHGRASVDIFAILKDLTVRRLQVPIIFVVEWDEALIVPALKMGAVDYVLKTKAAFEALSVRIDRLRSGSILAREFDDLLRQQAELRASLDHATTDRAALEVQLANAETTVQATAERHAAVMRTAAELQQQQTQYQTELARTTEARDALAEQLNEATSALDQARQKQASDAAAADRLARREAELAAQLDEEAAARHALQQELSESEQRASEERTATAQESSQLRAQLEERLAEELAGREEATRKLKDLTKALAQTRRARAADATTAAEQLSRREHELSEAIAETAATRDVLEQRVTAAEAALRAAVECANGDREALVAAGSKQEADFEARLADAASVRHALEQKVAATEATLRDTIERHASEMASASERLVAERETLVEAASKREFDFETRLADAGAVRRALEEKVAGTEATLRDAAERRTKEIAQSETQLAEMAVARELLQQQLNDVSTALENALQARTMEAAEGGPSPRHPRAAAERHVARTR